ncbi:MAG TPA: translation initiation factor IF-3 [Polyangia bacterium]|nr:translation initiation factor IF-3 [Polyangia bacterium]
MARPSAPPTEQYRVNRRIRVPEVRVIGADGTQLGVMATQEALRQAEDSGLDLVEVSPKAMPPVCRIMDYGKFKYETAKKQKQARKHQTVVIMKEVKFRPKTEEHDLDFKVRAIRRFLEEGNKARLVIVFRGREIVHPETGQAVLQRVVQRVADVASVEQIAMMEGRRMSMVIGPKPHRGAPPPGARPGPAPGPVVAPAHRPAPPPAAATAPAPAPKKP